VSFIGVEADDPKPPKPDPTPPPPHAVHFVGVEH
jgi:hypothetical protein